MALLLSLPFVIVVRAGWRTPSVAVLWASLLAAAAVAATGVLLKPTVALVPALLLAASALQRRSCGALVEPHFVLMLAAAAAYASVAMASATGFRWASSA